MDVGEVDVEGPGILIRVLPPNFFALCDFLHFTAQLSNEIS